MISINEKNGSCRPASDSITILLSSLRRLCCISENNEKQNLTFYPQYCIFAAYRNQAKT